MGDGRDAARQGEPIPALMRGLPIFAGWPVPWFCGWKENHPDWRAPLAEEKFHRAHLQKLCLVCGVKLDPLLLRPPGAFFGDAVISLERISTWLPAHLACAGWSLRNCPYMRNPEQYDDRVDFAGEVQMLWLTRNWDLISGAEMTLIQLGPPEKIEWYKRGRNATRAEVTEALDKGRRTLEQIIGDDWPGGRVNLRRRIERLQKWLPIK